MNKPLIKSWSYSRLVEYELCPYRSKLKIIDKIPEPDRPLPPGKTEHANDRGTRIHNELENYIRGTGAFPKEAHRFELEVNAIKRAYEEGKVSLEGEWGFDRNWQPCDYKTAWLRVKLDVSYLRTKKHLIVVDYKSGRKDGNEIKHGEQVMLYGLCAAIREPSVEVIDTELYYLDQSPGDDGSKNFSSTSKPASKWLYHLKAFNNRGLKMTNATEFPPMPSAFACQWCPYKDGICEFAHSAKPVRRKGGVFVRRKGQ